MSKCLDATPRRRPGEKETLAALVADPDREPLAKEGGEIESVSGPRTVTYENDALNRLSMNDPNNGMATIFAANHLNQYTSVTDHGTLSYDGNFDVLGYDGWTFGHDAEKRLLSVTGHGHSALFAYDGLGRCVKRIIDGATTVFTYDGWKPVAEWTSGGTFVAWNLYGVGADEVLVRYQQNPAGYLHYHLDAMGNVQFLLSDQPNPGLEKYTYDVFGKPTITGWNGDGRPVSNHGNRFLFTGREYLYSFGLYDYRHRTYHPGLGRFIETDPLGQQIEGAKLSAEEKALYLDGGAPETFSSSELNLYRYCHNDPVANSDPFGLDFSPYTGKPIQVDTLRGGDGMGESVPDVKVVPVSLGDGTFTLRLDVQIIAIYVANRVHFHSKTKLTDRSQAEKDATFELHEKGEHGKDWSGFHEKHKDEIPKAAHDKQSADKAAAALTEKYKSEAFKANRKFNEHQPESRWKKITDQEKPH
jgi:RHS repeat-associated protein